ncbi:MAG: VWA domain-containing protein [Nitrospira sp.]|nr:VWA domain-containing protein [Nitrospira sp.]
MTVPAVLEFFHSLQFQYPIWLWLIPVSLLLLTLLLVRRKLLPLRQLPNLFGTARFRHTQIALLRQLQEADLRQRASRDFWRQWFGYALLMLAVHTALAFPYRFGPELPKPPAYRDTVFLLDTSVSMMLRDYLVAGQRVDRMTLLKSVITLFIDRLDGNRISLIPFSEQAYTLVPLTADYDLLRAMVRRLQPAVLTGRNSDLGNALLYALHDLERRLPQSVEEKPVLVLVSDVNRPLRDVDPRAVADFLRRQGYRLHTIGIGATSYAAEDKGVTGLIYEPANFSLLKAIAAAGGGRFYWADNAGSLSAAMTAIQAAERRQVDVAAQYIKLPLYHWSLGFGLLWLMLLQLLPARMRR